MTRIAQKPALRGSQRWLQLGVGNCPDLLQPADWPRLQWRAPVIADEFAEYMDASFLKVLDLGHLEDALAGFWPRSGPRWDGLAVFPGGVVLVEAKAHVPEALSTPCAAGPTSLRRIAASLEHVKTALGADARSDWCRVLYQQANRLAHLWFLREHGIDARLLYVNFLGDSHPQAPRHPETWAAVQAVADYALGLPARHALRPFIAQVAPDVRLIERAAAQA